MKETKDAVQFFAEKVKECFSNKIGEKSGMVSSEVYFGKRDRVSFSAYGVDCCRQQYLRSRYTCKIMDYDFNYGLIYGDKDAEIERLHVWVHNTASMEAVKYAAKLLELPIVNIDKGGIAYLTRTGKRMQLYVFTLSDGTCFTNCGMFYRVFGEKEWKWQVRAL